MKAYKIITDGITSEYFDYEYVYSTTIEILNRIDKHECYRIGKFATSRGDFVKLNSEHVVYDGDPFIITHSCGVYRVYSDEEIPLIYERFVEVVRVVDALRAF